MISWYYFSDRIHALVYAPLSKQLLSAGDDSAMVLWDMGVKRKEVSLKIYNKTCQHGLCGERTPCFKWHFCSDYYLLLLINMEI